MDPKVVFFGEADYGKSTVIGYLYAESLRIDMDRAERRLKEKIGSHYHPGILYSSLINPDVVETITKEDKVIQETTDIKHLTEGAKILKDTEDELVIQSTTIIGSTAKIITTTHKRRFKRGLNSVVRHLRNIGIDDCGDPVKLTMIDTPGHAPLLSEREMGMSMGDIGIFCLAVNEVLSDDFDGLIFELTDLWAQYNRNRKLIYLLTKFDLAGYGEAEYRAACEKIRLFCKCVNVEYQSGGLGSFVTEEANVEAVIPAAVLPENRESVNLISRSGRTPWYEGPSLIEAVKGQMFELANAVRERLPENLLFSVDKEIANPRSKVGKVWRIVVRNGCLGVNDEITLTSVNLAGRPKTETFDVKATVKSIREDLDIAESAASADAAYKDSIVTIDLKSCYADGKRVDKSDIRVTKQSAGFAAGERVRPRETFFIRFADAEKAFCVIRAGQEVMLLRFGKRIPSKIIDIPDSADGMTVRLLHGKTIAVPDDRVFRETGMLRDVKVLTQYEGMNWHFSGMFEYDEEGCLPV